MSDTLGHDRHARAGHAGREYWTPRGRGKLAMLDWGTGKREVHKQERRRANAEFRRELASDEASTNPCRNGTCRECADAA